MAVKVAVRRAASALVFAGALLLTALGAEADPILTVSNGENVVELTREDLEAMPQHTVATATEFTDGVVEFSGPLVRDVLDRYGLGEAKIVRLTAMNDYFVDVPTTDFANYNVIMALEADGKQLSRRDKGPIWLMYPLSEHEELSDPVYNARLIWQIVSVEAL